MALNKNILYFAIMALLLLGVGLFQSWNVSLSILNLCLISAIMALGLIYSGDMQAFSMLVLWVLLL